MSNIILDNFIKNIYSDLIEILSSYKRVAIAFSGGIDSTLLMYAAIDALGTDSVTGVTLSSCLQPIGFANNVASFSRKQFGEKANFIVTEIDPLSWSEFRLNNERRCYHCKKKMYEKFITIAQNSIGTRSDVTLCDGTNYSDLSKDRPGYKAIKEFNIVTPLADVFLEKEAIRGIARWKNISNWNLASDSCLATRIETDTPITLSLLKTIEKAEKYLHEIGFEGCRVRHRGRVAVMQVLDCDFTRISMLMASDSDAVIYLKTLGYENVILDSKPLRFI